MDLHLLIEARKKSTRGRENQRARDQYLGRDAETVRSLGWRRRIVYIMRELRMPAAEQRTAMAVLSKVENKRGAAFLNNQDSETLKATLKAFQAEFKRRKEQARHIRHPSHMRPGVSGVYTQGGVLTGRSSLEREGVSTYGKPAGSHQLRMNTAHIDTSDMDQKELASHSHPDIRKIYKAIDPNKEKLRRDSAVVWTADDKPFYLLGQLTKPVHRQYMGKDFNFMFPRALDYRGGKKIIPLNRLDDIGVWTKWYTMMRSKDLFKMTDPTTRKVIVKKGNIDAVIKNAQAFAWKHAKNFYEAYQGYRLGKAAVKEIRAKYKLRGGGYKRMAPEDKKVHDQAWGVWQASEGQLKGELPNIDFKDEQERQAWEQKLAHMGDSYTWYLWLLASEHQHGVRLPERQKLPENHKQPQTKNPVQNKPEHWVIQPTGREEIPRWDTRVLKGVGFSQGDFRSFEVALKNSGYKLGFQGNKAITHLWVPLVGDLHRLYGLDASPADISDYINDSRKQSKTDYIVGREAGGIEVRKHINVPQYKFMAGNPRRQYSLIPAVPYLQHFDSPKHGGSRLVHGQKYLQEPPPKTKHKMDSRSATSRLALRGRQRSHSYQMKRYARSGISPRFAYDLERLRHERENIAQEIADRMLQQPKERDRRAIETWRKIQQRKNLIITGPDRQAIRVWRPPVRQRGFIHSKEAMWELPPVGPVMRTRRHPVTGTLMRIRRQPTRKVYRIRSTGSRPAKKSTTLARYELHTVPRQAVAPTWDEYWDEIVSNHKLVDIDGERYTKADLMRDKPEHKRTYEARLRAFIRKAHAKGFIVIDGPEGDHKLELVGNTVKRVKLDDNEES